MGEGAIFLEGITQSGVRKTEGMAQEPRIGEGRNGDFGAEFGGSGGSFIASTTVRRMGARFKPCDVLALRAKRADRFEEMGASNTQTERDRAATLAKRVEAERATMYCSTIEVCLDYASLVLVVDSAERFSEHRQSTYAMKDGDVTATPALPPTLDIYELARQNGENIRKRYETTRDRAGDTAEVLERFCERVQRDGRVSISAKSTRLLWMLRKGYYPNPYDEARERARDQGGDTEEYLKQQQGDYYLKRVTFDRSFVDGENFRYASLNIGGGGLAHYGLYCIVIRDPAAGERAALLPANSLKRFMHDPAELDVSALQREVAAWPDRHHLTALKHAHEIAEVPEHSWSQMMCHASKEPDCFVEIILGSPVTPPLIAEIRVDKQRLHELMTNLLSDTLTDSERTELNTRLEVFEELANHKLDMFYREV